MRTGHSILVLGVLLTAGETVTYAPPAGFSLGPASGFVRAFVDEAQVLPRVARATSPPSYLTFGICYALDDTTSTVEICDLRMFANRGSTAAPASVAALVAAGGLPAPVHADLGTPARLGGQR